jgi:hypothetical protein
MDLNSENLLKLNEILVGLRDKTSDRNKSEAFLMKCRQSLNSIIKNLKTDRQKNLLIFGFPRGKEYESVEKVFFLFGLDVNSINYVTRSLGDSETAPIVVNCKHKSTVVNALRAAKHLRFDHFSRKISISPDLLLKERMTNRKLIAKRKLLNRELRQSVPNADYYYLIKNNEIVKKSQSSMESKACLENIYNLISSNNLDESREKNADIMKDIIKYIFDFQLNNIKL